MSARTTPGVAVATLTLAFMLSVATVSEAQILKVKHGDMVSMTDTAGRQAEGVVRGVGPSALTVLVNGREEQWRLAETREIWRGGDSLRNGVLIGMLAGAGAGLLGGYALGSLYENETGSGSEAFLGMFALGLGGGGAIGAAFDAMHKGRTLVHRQSTPAVLVVPRVSRDVRGVQLAVRF